MLKRCAGISVSIMNFTSTVIMWAIVLSPLSVIVAEIVTYLKGKKDA